MPLRGAKLGRGTKLVGGLRNNLGAFTVVAVLACAVIELTIHNVSTRPSADDALYIGLMLAKGGHAAVVKAPGTFSGEIAEILAVQDSVLQAAPVNAGIPIGLLREPRELYETAEGLCYDRSRTIEKALDILGFKTRHVAVYAETAGSTVLAMLLTRGVSSHALTEVLTSRGWMLVDSNTRWIGLRHDGQPVSVQDLPGMNGPGMNGLGESVWSDQVPGRLNGIFTKPYVAIYGLYSRHGGFYPPNDMFPDVNFADLAYNVPVFFSRVIERMSATLLPHGKSGFQPVPAA